MTIQLYDQNNQVVQSGTTAESGVEYTTYVDVETYEVRGSLFIKDLQVSPVNYLKFMRQITAKNAAYFKAVSDTGNELVISTLFLRDIQMQYVAGRLSLRAVVLINDDNSQQFEQFMSQF